MILRGNFFSQKLEMETSITIVAPDKPAVSPCKVVYLLHGLCGRSGDWVDYTLLPNYAKEYHTIFIMPEVARSFYSDMKYGLNYYSYVTEELPSITRSIFNISSKRDDIAIMGASMGGYGALKCALSKPEQYAYCCAFSSPCLMLKESLRLTQGAVRFKEFFGEQLLKDFQAVFGEHVEWSPREDVVELAHSIVDKPNKPRIFLACGTEDSFYPDNKKYHDILIGMGLNSVFEDWQGDHSWAFFDQALRRALVFCFGSGNSLSID